MKLKWADIDSDEKFHLRTHPSRWMLAEKVTIGVLIVFTAIYLAFRIPFFELSIAVAISGLIIGFGMIGYGYVRWKTTVYLITSKQIYYKIGIFKRGSVDPIEIPEVADQEYTQSVFDRIVNKGDFYIKTKGTGDTEVTFADVPNPEGVLRELRKAKKGYKERETRERYQQMKEMSESDGDSEVPIF